MSSEPATTHGNEPDGMGRREPATAQGDPLRVASSDGRPAIEVRSLSKRFGQVEAVSDVSFSVAAGETFGFLGPNGAGKTTTISILCTLLRPTGGSATVDGFDVVAQPSEVRRRLGLVFQDTTLDDYLTAEENLRFHAELYGMPRSSVDPRIHEVLTMVGLWERRESAVVTFSGGMKRRLEIARGLMHSPRVLFLDEPTIGLDPQTRSHIWAYVDELRRSEGITILLTTHYMDEAEHCDRIGIIDHGKLVVLDTPEALKQSVGQDRVEIRTSDDARSVEEIRERFGLEATMAEGSIRLYVPRGDEFVPRLFAELSTRIDSVNVARPTLDDVFMAYTGRTIRDAEATDTDRMAAFVRARRGRR